MKSNMESSLRRISIKVLNSHEIQFRIVSIKAITISKTQRPSNAQKSMEATHKMCKRFNHLI